MTDKQNEIIVDVDKYMNTSTTIETRASRSGDPSDNNGTFKENEKLYKASAQGSCVTSFGGIKYMLCSYLFVNNDKGKITEYDERYIKIFRYNESTKSWDYHNTVGSNEWGHMNGITAAGNKIFILKDDTTIVVQYFKDIFVGEKDEKITLNPGIIFKSDVNCHIKGLSFCNDKLYGYTYRNFKEKNVGRCYVYELELDVKDRKIKKLNDILAYSVDSRLLQCPAGVRVFGNNVYCCWDYHNTSIKNNCHAVVDVFKIDTKKRCGEILLAAESEFEALDIVNLSGKLHYMFYYASCYRKPLGSTPYYGGKSFFVPM